MFSFVPGIAFRTLKVDVLFVVSGRLVLASYVMAGVAGSSVGYYWLVAGNAAAYSWGELGFPDGVPLSYPS